MAVLKLYPNGITAGKPGLNTNIQKRGLTQGWTPAVSRRMTKWLYSVGIPKLTGSGYSFTFTIKDCPPTSEDWKKLVFRLAKRFDRLSSIRLHWLTEWQRRGVPHLHGCVYFDNENVTSSRIVDCWIECSKQYSPSRLSQNVKPIFDETGWYKYLSKHAVRGVIHYQRNSKNIPAEWKGNTGRMWGKRGDWGVTEPISFNVDNKSYNRFRRIIRNWRKSKARDDFEQIYNQLLRTYKCDSYKFEQALKNIGRSRRLLKSNNRKVASVRGINEFFDHDTAMTILLHLSSYEDSDISN